MKRIIKAICRMLVFLLTIIMGCVIYDVVEHCFGRVGIGVLLGISFICLFVINYLGEKEE